MKGLSKEKMYHVEWYLARASEEQLRYIKERIDKKITEKMIARTQTGFDKFQQYEVQDE